MISCGPTGRCPGCLNGYAIWMQTLTPTLLWIPSLADHPASEGRRIAHNGAGCARPRRPLSHAPGPCVEVDVGAPVPAVVSATVRTYHARPSTRTVELARAMSEGESQGETSICAGWAATPSAAFNKRRGGRVVDKIAGSDFGQRSWPERSEGESQGRDEHIPPSPPKSETALRGPF